MAKGRKLTHGSAASERAGLERETRGDLLEAKERELSQNKN